ncbi:THUMP-like domain-containing protein [Rothia sp. CCM 9419]|uniref:class I SAM-dependent methyltransferase n=1 Tax=Rothia sp. CCM 9419 TaxID=3402662 RepID=UPI003AECDC42
MSTSVHPAPAVEETQEELEAIALFVPYNDSHALNHATQLRAQGFSADSVHKILTQAKNRTKALEKFGQQAHQMLLTEAGYEQSTRQAVAMVHAQRFAQAQIDSVADLGCGIGADSLSFAQAGLAVTAVEIDQRTASYAQYNLMGFPSAQVFCADIEQLDLAAIHQTFGRQIDGLWLDPARRTVQHGKTQSRTFDAEDFSPPLSFIRKLAQTGIAMGVKMGPAIPHDQIPEECEAQWISHQGSVVEVVLWFNALARPHVKRSALVLDSDPFEPSVITEVSSPYHESHSQQQASEPLYEVKEYIYEPDGALIRAHLLGEIIRTTDAELIDEHIAYLTSSSPLQVLGLKGYRVEQVLPINDKHLKRWVRENNITTLTIKKRGVDISPEQLRIKLLGHHKNTKKSVTGRSGTLILTRIGEGKTSRRLALAVSPL